MGENTAGVWVVLETLIRNVKDKVFSFELLSESIGLVQVLL